MRIETIVPRVKAAQRLLQNTTLRDFKGGWNVLDDDMNLSFKFATRFENCYADNDGTVRIRQGTSLFADCLPYFSTAAYIVNIEYFNNALIVVGSNGQILKVLADGTVSRIWDATIAAALPGAPAAWSTISFASFAAFNTHLIVVNGVDKPIDINQSFVVQYLYDKGTGSNLNVPICKYVVSINRYLVMAGDPLQPDRVHISAKDAAGTWYGDPPPNDATRIDVGSVLPNATVIRGLTAFRGKLIVSFAEGLIFGTLGQYNVSGSHTPNFDDGVTGYGSISHRSAIASGDDGLFLDLEGVPSIKRTALSTSFKPERVSGLIDPEIKKALSSLSYSSLENRTFALHNRADGQYMLFVPNTDNQTTTTETVVFVYNYRPALGQDNWSRFRGWNFTCGCRSLAGLIFFGDKNGKIWLYGSETNPINTDYIQPSNQTGVGIAFDWEMPWLDFGKRMNVKHLKYIQFDTRGASEFTTDFYIDNFLDVPARSMSFSGGEQGSFGAGLQPYGGGRDTSIKKKYAFPVKFLIGKLRIRGTANQQLAFVSLSLDYQIGGINR